MKSARNVRVIATFQSTVESNWLLKIRLCSGCAVMGVQSGTTLLAQVSVQPTWPTRKNGSAASRHGSEALASHE